MSNNPIPHISEWESEISFEESYEVQKKYINLRLQKDSIYGFKAGISNKKSQNKYSITEPLSGVLFTSGKYLNGEVINNNRKYFLELEIGYILKNDINQKISNISELKENIEFIVPVVEIPDINFKDIKFVKVVDIIASNVASRDFIIGSKVKDLEINLDKLEPKLYRNNTLLTSGSGSDAMGSQWDTALWLVNKNILEGWKLKKGNLLITGVIGKIVPATQGNYIGDFGKLGKISFTLK